MAISSSAPHGPHIRPGLLNSSKFLRPERPPDCGFHCFDLVDRGGANGMSAHCNSLPRTLCHTESVFSCLRTHQELESLRMPGQPNPEFLRRAIALATRNVLTATGGPFGAVVVRDGKIVGEGANSVTTTNDPTA